MLVYFSYNYDEFEINSKLLAFNEVYTDLIIVCFLNVKRNLDFNSQKNIFDDQIAVSYIFCFKFFILILIEYKFVSLIRPFCILF